MSYARVNKPHCIRIVDKLNAHEVWYDQRLYAGQHWWREIMRRLEWCDVFLYLLSPDSVNSQYCQKEYEIAKKLGRPIIPILIDEDTIVPPELEEYQYIKMIQLDADNVALLLNAITMLSKELMNDNGRSQMPSLKPTRESGIEESPFEMSQRGMQALQNKDYDNAIMWLKRAQEYGYDASFVDLDSFINIAERALSDQTVNREYKYIAELFKYEVARRHGCKSLRSFLDQYPNHDPDNLRRFCMRKPQDAPSHGGGNGHHNPSHAGGNSHHNPSHDGSHHPRRHFHMNLLEWCEIPAGNVDTSSVPYSGESYGDKTVHVDTFYMSKYPVTIEQFNQFLHADDGYCKPDWWNFSHPAKQWFNNPDKAPGSRFIGDDLPCETVNWYEAVAFCNWLSYKLGMKILLPTIAQWQRAVRGDSMNLYPWGDEYRAECCNTVESNLKKTTPVTQYPEGASPYGVCDMAGNVWEWTFDIGKRKDKSDDDVQVTELDDESDCLRGVIGGSHVSQINYSATIYKHYLPPKSKSSSIGFRLVYVK
jgi:formylglycine-generating enzyme required for sulfatase activity